MPISRVNLKINPQTKAPFKFTTNPSHSGGGKERVTTTMTPSSSPQRPNEQDRNTSTSEISVSEGSSITSRSESDIDTETETVSREPSVQPAGNVAEEGDKREEENENDEELPVSTEPIIDYEIFGQILEMNEVDESGESDDEEENFVRGLVTNYYDQAVSTFKSMDDAL